VLCIHEFQVNIPVLYEYITEDRYWVIVVITELDELICNY